MGFEWVTDFECATCGTEASATGVSYDRLGYPVCPDCGESAGPTVGDAEAEPQAAD